MKVPPKRKGNTHHEKRGDNFVDTLNESPSEKEGKFDTSGAVGLVHVALNESPSEKEGK